MKKLIGRKNLLRLFSLAVAGFIWIYVVSSAEIEVTKNIPIEVEIPDKYAISNRWDQEVQYRIKGPGLFVRKFLDRELFMRFNKSDYYQKGKLKYRLIFDRSKIKLPLGVELVDIQPRVLNINLERSMQKTVAVKAVMAEGVIERNKIEEVKLKPSKIEISGPRSVIRNITSVETQVIDSTKLNDDRSFIQAVKIDDPRVKAKTDFVNVSYSLIAQTKEFTFSDLPIIFQTVKLISKVEPKVVSVVLKGDSNVMEKLTKEKIKIIADVPSGKQGSVEVQLKAQIDAKDVEVISIFPPKVKLVLE